MQPTSFTQAEGDNIGESLFAIALFLVGVRNMSIKDKPSLCFVVSDIDFFFSHRAALAKKLSEKFQIIVISDIKESKDPSF